MQEGKARRNLWPRKRVISEFSTRDALLDAVMASTIIPGITAPRPHCNRPAGSRGCSRQVIEAATTRSRGCNHMQAPHPHPTTGGGFQLDGVKVLAPPASAEAPQLRIEQMAAAR